VTVFRSVILSLTVESIDNDGLRGASVIFKLRNTLASHKLHSRYSLYFRRNTIAHKCRVVLGYVISITVRVYALRSSILSVYLQLFLFMLIDHIRVL